MGIESNIARLCNQTAVYWGNPVDDGYGGKDFDDPVEIACRWEDKISVMSDAQGNQFVSKSVVYVLQDLDEEGYLFLGTLDDLDEDTDSSGSYYDPRVIDQAFEIKAFDKSPNLKATEFVRKAYL